jgi:hypothetical protein
MNFEEQTKRFLWWNLEEVFVLRASEIDGMGKYEDRNQRRFQTVFFRYVFCDLVLSKTRVEVKKRLRNRL